MRLDKMVETLAGYTEPKKPVAEYITVSSKQFSDYKSVAGDQSVDYNVIEGLYRKTIMNRVINKMAGDATRLSFEVQYVDMTGAPHEEAMQKSILLETLITRKMLKTTFRDLLLYGDAFIYNVVKGVKGDIDPLKVPEFYNLNPKNIYPRTESQQLVGWRYNTSSGNIDLNLDDLIHIANNPITGDVFGISIFEPLLQVLHLMLNSQMDVGVILDRFAIPLLHWSIDSGNPRKKTKPEEIKKLLLQIEEMRQGYDVGTDATVKSEPIGFGGKAVDIQPILEKLEQHFFATSGVPGQILGMPADNLSAIGRQLQTYYETIFDLQETVSDELVRLIFKPFMYNNGITDLKRIDISWGKPMLESQSRIMAFVATALDYGLISHDEGRQAIGYSGVAPNPQLPALEILKQRGPSDNGGNSSGGTSGGSSGSSSSGSSGSSSSSGGTK